ncbi:phage tail sheath family protein [Candidatus Pantoea multigeneris]|nr:phage tail sheath family protein [Pantoea multigeneris]
MSNYPGVFIKENNRLALASPGMSKLVPLLVGRFRQQDNTPLSLSYGPVWIENWQHYCQLLQGAQVWVEVETDSLPDSLQPERSAVHSAAFALRSYFENGGGPCYILSLAQGDEIARLSEILAQRDDISLMALIDVGHDDEAILTQLGGLTSRLPQSFLLLRYVVGSGNPPRYGEQAQSACYTPDLVPRQPLSIQASDIWLRDLACSLSSLAQGTAKQRETYRKVKQWLNLVTVDYQHLNTFTLSPCAPVAGLYCRTERQLGVWQASANLALEGVDPQRAIGNAQHGDLNERGVNAILWQEQGGTTVMGARTLATSSDSSWRYIPVRLLFNTVERDVRNLLLPVVYQPNSAGTWQSARAAINQYLHRLWQQGGLYGETPQQAFQVELALTSSELSLGILRIRIGLAALRPVEFLWLDFSQDLMAA